MANWFLCCRRSSHSLDAVDKRASIPSTGTRGKRDSPKSKNDRNRDNVAPPSATTVSGLPRSEIDSTACSSTAIDNESFHSAEKKEEIDVPVCEGKQQQQEQQQQKPLLGPKSIDLNDDDDAPSFYSLTTDEDEDDTLTDIDREDDNSSYYTSRQDLSSVSQSISDISETFDISEDELPRRQSLWEILDEDSIDTPHDRFIRSVQRYLATETKREKARLRTLKRTKKVGGTGRSPPRRDRHVDRSAESTASSDNDNDFDYKLSSIDLPDRSIQSTSEGCASTGSLSEYPSDEEKDDEHDGDDEDGSDVYTEEEISSVEEDDDDVRYIGLDTMSTIWEDSADRPRQAASSYTQRSRRLSKHEEHSPTTSSLPSEMYSSSPPAVSEKHRPPWVSPNSVLDITPRQGNTSSGRRMDPSFFTGVAEANPLPTLVPRGKATDSPPPPPQPKVGNAFDGNRKHATRSATSPKRACSPKPRFIGGAHRTGGLPAIARDEYDGKEDDELLFITPSTPTKPSNSGFGYGESPDKSQGEKVEMEYDDDEYTYISVTTGDGSAMYSETQTLVSEYSYVSEDGAAHPIEPRSSSSPDSVTGKHRPQSQKMTPKGEGGAGEGKNVEPASRREQKSPLQRDVKSLVGRAAPPSSAPREVASYFQRDDSLRFETTTSSSHHQHHPSSTEDSRSDSSTPFKLATVDSSVVVVGTDDRLIDERSLPTGNDASPEHSHEKVEVEYDDDEYTFVSVTTDGSTLISETQMLVPENQGQEPMLPSTVKFDSTRTFETFR